MERARFDEYIGRFNGCDDTDVDGFTHPDLRMQNGGLVFHNVQG